MGRAITRAWWGLSMVELLLACFIALHILHITYYTNLHTYASPPHCFQVLQISCCFQSEPLLCLSFHSCIRLSLLSTYFSPLFSLSFSVCSRPCFYPLLPPLGSSLPSFPGPQLSLCVTGISPTPWPVCPRPPSVLFHSRSLICFRLSNFSSSPYFCLFTSHVPVPPPQLQPSLSLTRGQPYLTFLSSLRRNCRSPHISQVSGSTSVATEVVVWELHLASRKEDT